jgi:hypothetical protein
VLLIAVTLLVVAGRIPDAGAAPLTVTSGHVDWGVKASFRTYVTGPVGHGTITPSAGATTNADSTFRFPTTGGTIDGTTSLGVVATGQVNFSAHAGALDLTIRDLRVERAGTGGTLLADVVSRDLSTGSYDTYDDVAVATLDFSTVAPSVAGAETTYTTVPATLTEGAVAAFGDFYPAGTPLDPVTVVVSTSTAPTTTTTAGPTTTGPTTTTSTVAPPTFAPPSVEPHGTASATGPTGQTLTATPVEDLDPNGTRVTVSGTGFDRGLGVYVAFCVDRGDGVAPTPCLGGADTSGESDTAAWISDNPPPYGEDLAQPFGPGGSFVVELDVIALTTAPDGMVLANCLDGSTRCVITTRADHTAAADRSADVKIPVTFAGQTGPAPVPPAAPANPIVPQTFPPAAPLPATGDATGGIAVTGAALVVAGVALVGGVRRGATRRA